MMHRLKEVWGYARLNVTTIIVAACALSAILYQLAVSGSIPRVTNTGGTQKGPTEIQLFPQTLPMQSQVKYLLQVISSDPSTPVRVASFWLKSKDVLTGDNGAVIDQGIFPLPESVTSVQSVRIAIYDDHDALHPVTIPFLEGDIESDRAILHFAANGLDQASGSVMMATPTDNNSLVNERSGIWFGNVLTNTPALNLPPPPAGWVYEGWAIINGMTLTTGRFTSASAPDRFRSFSDTKASSPNFPGEDLLRDPPVAIFPNLHFPTDLAGQTVEITLEPETANGDPTGGGKFPTTILQIHLSRLAESGRLYPMTNVTSDLPKVTAVLR